MGYEDDNEPWLDAAEFESQDEEFPIPRSLHEFLDEHGILKVDSGHADMVAWPIPGRPLEEGFLQLYVRNSAPSHPVPTFTVARLEFQRAPDLDPTREEMFQRLDDLATERLPYGRLHGTGSLRTLIAELERILPLHGYTRILVEEVVNHSLAEVLVRYGFQEDDQCYWRDIKDLSALAPNGDAIQKWERRRRLNALKSEFA